MQSPFYDFPLGPLCIFSPWVDQHYPPAVSSRRIFTLSLISMQVAIMMIRMQETLTHRNGISSICLMNDSRFEAYMAAFSSIDLSMDAVYSCNTLLTFCNRYWFYHPELWSLIPKLWYTSVQKVDSSTDPIKYRMLLGCRDPEGLPWVGKWALPATRDDLHH